MKLMHAAIGVFLCLPVAAEAANWSVNPEGTGSCPTIQAALDSAAATGDFITIEGGIYLEENLVVSGKDVFVTFNNGNVYVTAPVPGSGTGISIGEATAAFNLFGISFLDFDTAISISNGSPTVSYANIAGCGTGISVSGASSAPDLSFCFVDSCGVGVEMAGGLFVDAGNHTIVDCGTGVRVSGATGIVQRSIIYGCDVGIEYTSGSITIDCNDFWLNDIDASGTSIPGGNIFELPRFCFVAAPHNPYFLHIDSPCWSVNNACGVNMGAFTVTWGCEGTAVRESTWGAIKADCR